MREHEEQVLTLAALARELNRNPPLLSATEIWVAASPCFTAKLSQQLAIELPVTATRFKPSARLTPEWKQQQQHGFDFCYDKRLYDLLEHDNAESVRPHLSPDLAYQRKLLRFLVN
jgi:hypothetical protein